MRVAGWGADVRRRCRATAALLGAALIVALPLGAREKRPARAPGAPRVIVLGTAQDGGFPHAACSCTRCRDARARPARARRIASLALHVPRSGHTYLLDATPDVREQLERLRPLRAGPQGRVDRAPLHGVLLTHAHIGHYLGLAFFGLEAIHTRDLPLFVSPRLAAYLRANGPWGQLVRLGNVALREIEVGRPFELEDGLSVTALQVPHRDEFSDTLAFVLRGPRRALLYVPDTDAWSAWSTPLTQVLEGVDVALLDATFYSPDELPERDVSRVRHPLMTTTMDLLQPLVRARKLRVGFTHFNHSNPVLDGDGRVRRAVEARGFEILDDGDEFEL